MPRLTYPFQSLALAAPGANSCGSACEFSELARYAQQKDWKSLHQNDAATGYAQNATGYTQFFNGTSLDTLRPQLDMPSGIAGYAQV